VNEHVQRAAKPSMSLCDDQLHFATQQNREQLHDIVLQNMLENNIDYHKPASQLFYHHVLHLSFILYMLYILHILSLPYTFATSKEATIYTNRKSKLPI
jgi:hypothetical protein